MNFKKIMVLILTLTYGLLTLPAQNKHMSDSVYVLKNVEIVSKEKKKVEFMQMDVPLKHLPMTVTPLNGVTLERKGILNLDDAVRFMPGVTVTDQYGAFQRYAVRGSTNAAVTINGVRDERTLLTSTPFGDLSSVESIEVIKGPASILAGHSVMGGVINIVQKRPTDKFTANARIAYGSWREKESTIGFGGKLYGPVNFRTNIHYSTSEGYRQVGANRFSGIFAVNSEVTKDGFLEVNASFNDDKYRTEIGSAPLMPENIYSTATNELFAQKNDFNPLADYHTVYNDIANNKMHRKNIDLSVQYTHKLTDWMKVRERFTWGHSDLDYSAVEHLLYRISDEPVYDWYYTEKDGGKIRKVYIELDSLKSEEPLCFNPDSRGYTNTFELTGKFTTGALLHNYTGGWAHSFFDYTQYNGYAAGDVWGPGVNQMLPVVSPHTVRNWWDSKVSTASIRRYTTNGIYLYDVMDINEKWKAMLGGRMDLFHYKKATATISDGRQHYDKENRTDWGKTKTSAFTYRVGVVYLPVPEVSVYASGSSYFKPDVTLFNKNTVYLNKSGNRFYPDAEGGEVFLPEKGKQAELGARYELNNVLEVNASIFYIDKFNVVKNLGKMKEEEDGAVKEKSVQGQVGREASKGFDLDITVRPLPDLQIVGGWGWSDYRLRKSRVNKKDWPDYSEVTNQRATGTPRTTCYLYADYTLSKGMLKSLSFHLSGTYRDRIYRSIADHTYFPSLFLMDAGVYYTVKERIHFSLVVNNILDKEYFVKATTLGKPRNFMAGISYTM